MAARKKELTPSALDRIDKVKAEKAPAKRSRKDAPGEPTAAPKPRAPRKPRGSAATTPGEAPAAAPPAESAVAAPAPDAPGAHLPPYNLDARHSEHVLPSGGVTRFYGSRREEEETTLVYDTETTGLLKPSTAPLEEQPKIIEFAVAEIGEDFRLIATHAWLIYPGEQITPEITKITGIKNEDLAGKPLFIEVLPEIERVFLGKHRVIAHNLPFDMGMLTNSLKRLGREFAFPYPPKQVCTVQLAHDLLYGRRAKMLELYERATGRPLAQTHRALDDVMALCEIVRAYRW